MATISLPPLANWQDFERLCCDLWQRKWKVQSAHLHGRQGQPQHGVDVFAAIDDGARWVGLQCKQTAGGFPSKVMLDDEVEKARKFLPPLSAFALATTARNDTNAQEWARQITKAQRAIGSFPVEVFGWEDICADLAHHVDLVRRYYPDFSWPDESAQKKPAVRSEDPLASVRNAYLANLFAELEPVSMAVFGGGSHRSKTPLQEVFISLDVESGFRLPQDAKTHPTAEKETEVEPFDSSRKLGPRYHAEAAALVKGGKIRPLDKQPYGRRFTALEAAAEAQRLVLIGPAGSGKSTFGRFLVLCLAGEQLGRASASLAVLNRDRASAEGVELAPELRAWPHKAPLPFFVELRRLVIDKTFPKPRETGTARHLLDYLASRQPEPELRTLLQQALGEENGALVILDGLDETPAAEESRERLKQVIEGFACAWERCRILVTSRPYAYDEQRWRLDRFTTERLAPFDRAKRAAFVQGWYEHLAQRGDVDRDLAKPRSEDLTRQIEATRYLTPLAEKPLMLTMITDLHASEGGRLPGGRAELYKRSVDLLLDRWNQVQRETNIADRLGMGAEQLRRALEHLAYDVHKSRGRGEEKVAAPITAAELWEALDRERPQDRPVDDKAVRDYLHQRSGILLGESPTSYRFPHRSYQEFLAACHLKRLRFPNLLVEEVLADPPLWREVFLLAAGQTAETPYAAWALLEALVPADPESQVTAADPRFEHALCAGLALEETGLFQNVQRQDASKLERIRAWLQKALELGALSPVDRAQAGRVLGRLGRDGDQRPGIGLGEDGLPAIAWVTIEPGPFLMGDEKREVTLRHGFQIARYPVTNAQFQAFVQDGGYTKKWRKCWTKEGWKWKTEQKRQGPETRLREELLLPNHPRVAVTWYEAWAFSRWLGERRREPIFLPTEHQWERAARSIDGREFPWGDDEPDATRLNFNQTGIDQPCAVGMFPTGASWEGVLDLSGNIWEWTASRVTEKVREPEDALAEKPADLAGLPGAGRVLRGGSYWNFASWARSAFRDDGYPADVFGDSGFRVLLLSAPSDSR